MSAPAVQGVETYRPVRLAPSAGWRWGLRFTSLALACALAYANRFFMNVDGISYLDMAYAYFRGDWKMAINPYWGAGYSWLLGIFLAPFRVPMRYESEVVQLVNVLVFLVALLAFEYLLRGVSVFRNGQLSKSEQQIWFDPPTWWVVGYSTFLLVCVFLSPLNIVTPDLCVMVIVLLSSGTLLRLAVGQHELRWSLVLGATLGIGYLIKSPAFPMGLVYFGCAFLLLRRRKAYRAFAAGLALFLLLSLPYVAAISRAAGRLTLGENAHITYAHYVLGVTDFTYWQGQLPGMGMPRHRDATRKLMSAPDVYEFATAHGGTFPPYYDPSYWADGFVSHVDVRRQLHALRDSAGKLVEIAYLIPREYLFFLLFLILLQESAAAFWARLRRCWVIWLPALVGVGLYAPVLIESRYVGGYILLLCVALLCSLQFSQQVVTYRVFRATIFALALMLGYRFANEAAGQIRNATPALQWRVAQALAEQGIKPGDRVAQMLYHNRDAHYWAHLARVSIIAEVPYEQEREFWATAPQVQLRVEELLRHTGARVLVTENAPAGAAAAGWHNIPGTDYSFFLLNPSR